MNVLNEELNIVQNPALGAYLLWNFSNSYTKTHQDQGFAPIQIAAVILPLIWHKETLGLITASQVGKGLRSFADKFSDTKESKLDILLSINSRTLKMKSRTLESIRMGIGCGLLGLTEEGGIIGYDNRKPPKLPDEITKQARAAVKIGTWFALLSLREIEQILQLRF